MTPTLSDAQAAQSLALTQGHKAAANRDAAKLATLVAVYYQTRVDVSDPGSIDAWLELMIPRLIRASDSGAELSRVYFDAIRFLETGSRDFRATAAVGQVDAGVRKSLLTVGPYDMINKMRKIERLDAPPMTRQVMLRKAKEVTATSVAAAVVRHAQAGSRQTIYDAAAQDPVALGYIRITRPEPCAFCAMLASRGIHYRSFGEDSFDESDSRFTGDGDAKVHDGCGCSMKAIYASNDRALARNQTFVDMWERWGAGGGNAALRFRRGYDHWAKTGQYMSWDDANKGL